jgi:caa(3)-type oxidase subunit IV
MEQQPSGHHGPNLSAYLGVFLALCVFTAASFVVNQIFREAALTAMFIILAVAVCKAALVAAVFMHLKWDWGRLYFVIVPVAIMAAMMMVVLLPDGVMGWPE